jgi:hypothetical protein
MDASKAFNDVGKGETEDGAGPAETQEGMRRQMMESEPSNIIGRSMSYLDVSNQNEEEKSPDV